MKGYLEIVELCRNLCPATPWLVQKTTGYLCECQYMKEMFWQRLMYILESL